MENRVKDHIQYFSLFILNLSFSCWSDHFTLKLINLKTVSEDVSFLHFQYVELLLELIFRRLRVLNKGSLQLKRRTEWSTFHSIWSLHTPKPKHGIHCSFFEILLFLSSCLSFLFIIVEFKLNEHWILLIIFTFPFIYYGMTTELLEVQKVFMI